MKTTTNVILALVIFGTTAVRASLTRNHGKRFALWGKADRALAALQARTN